MKMGKEIYLQGHFLNQTGSQLGMDRLWSIQNSPYSVDLFWEGKDIPYCSRSLLDSH